MRLLYKQKIETEELQMKKFLAMLLVAAMVFSMAACAKAPEAAQPARAPAIQPICEIGRASCRERV